MPSESFEQKIERACKEGTIPGAVLIASDTQGRFRYEKSYGVRSLKDSKPMTTDSTMWMASCTKLITTIAAMQCVEKGLLNLDDDVTSIIPELKDRQILTGFDESGKPTLVKNEKSITLRHLLTHTSGLSYDVFNPILMQYQATRGIKPDLKTGKKLTEVYDFPLLFTPGEKWEYSVGIDFAGLMVERVNGNISLEDYFKNNIWGPLGVSNFTFHPKSHANVFENLCAISVREGGVNQFGTAANPDGKLVHTDNTIWSYDTPDCHGGAGGFGTPKGYQKVLNSIVSDDGKLLTTNTVNDMFTPQLGDGPMETVKFLLSIPEINQTLGGIPMGTKVSWGLGGLINLDDIPGRRKKGSMTWGGYPNLSWFMDRNSKMSGIYGSQIAPPGDLNTVNLFGDWETELYNKSDKEKL